MTEKSTTRPMACQVRAGDGPTVVLVHGIPGAAGAWAATLAALPPEPHVIVPDLIGFGASPAPSAYSVDELGPEPQSHALERLVEQHAAGPVTLVGHDFGAPVSILLADRRPDLVSGLVLLSGNAFPDTPVPFPLSLVTAPLISAVASRALFSRPSLRLMLRQGVGSGPAPDARTHLGDAGQQRAIAAIFREALRRLQEIYTPVEAALGRLAMPASVGWGDKDPFFPVSHAQRTAAAARGRLRVFEGAGHFLPHERPAELAAMIIGALDYAT